MIVRAVVEAVMSVALAAVAVGQQLPNDVPGAGYLTAAASGLAIVAIAQAVRSISRTEEAKREVARQLMEENRQLQDAVNDAHDEIRRLHEMLRPPPSSSS